MRPVVQVIGDTNLLGSLEALIPNLTLSMRKLFVCLISEIVLSLTNVDCLSQGFIN
jgi:hypothetical protein